MIIILFFLLFFIFLGLIYNCKDDTIQLQRKYYNLKDTIIVVSSKIQHQANFQGLDNTIELGYSQNIPCIVNEDYLKQCRPIYSLPFYVNKFNDFNYNNQFSYILDNNPEIYIKDIKITSKIIEVYSKYNKNYAQNKNLKQYHYDFFYPCFSSKLEGFIL